jgi:hypothetical protein
LRLARFEQEIFAQPTAIAPKAKQGGHVVTGLTNAAAKRLNDFDVWTRSTDLKLT